MLTTLATREIMVPKNIPQIRTQAHEKALRFTGRIFSWPSSRQLSYNVLIIPYKRYGALHVRDIFFGKASSRLRHGKREGKKKHGPHFVCEDGPGSTARRMRGSYCVVGSQLSPRRSIPKHWLKLPAHDQCSFILTYIVYTRVKQSVRF